MKTIEAFVKKVITAAPTDTLAAVAGLMQEHHVGAVVVIERHRPVGIVTDRDLTLHLGARGIARTAPVASIMSVPVQTAGMRDGIFDTTRAMKEARVRRLPVVDDEGVLVGMVTLDDLLRVLSQELSNLTGSMRAEMKVV